VVELKDIVPGPSDDESTHPLSAAAFFLTHGVPPLPSGAPVSTSNEASASMVGRCRLTVSKPVLKAPAVSALEATI
jgi:hypothetical protein